jgi:hypothetical protein
MPDEVVSSEETPPQVDGQNLGVLDLTEGMESNYSTAPTIRERGQVRTRGYRDSASRKSFPFRFVGGTRFAASDGSTRCRAAPEKQERARIDLIVLYRPTSGRLRGMARYRTCPDSFARPRLR